MKEFTTYSPAMLKTFELCNVVEIITNVTSNCRLFFTKVRNSIIIQTNPKAVIEYTFQYHNCHTYQ